MAKIQHTCTGCVPIDASIIEVYTQLIATEARAEKAAEKAEEASLGKAPYIGENGNWWEWDEPSETYVDTGVQAATGMTVDDHMSDSSTNPVQNKVVKEYIDEHTGSDPEAVKYTEQSLTTEQKAQARTNIGAGTSSFSGDYNDLSNKPTIPTVPVISTDISADATSDTKTASPKAVKDYVDAHGGGGGDDPEAVKYTEQSLTDSQQAQARTNIGAQEELVSGTSIKTLNNRSLLGSGNISIEDGVGLRDISSQADGTLVFTLSTGDTVTIDLNHLHSVYPKYLLCENQSEYDLIPTKESDKLYLIPES